LNSFSEFFDKLTRSSSCCQEAEACSQRQEFENRSEKFTALTETTGDFRLLKSKTYFDSFEIVGGISKILVIYCTIPRGTTNDVLKDVAVCLSLQ
jgi:hypothetical protein